LYLSWLCSAVLIIRAEMNNIKYVNRFLPTVDFTMKQQSPKLMYVTCKSFTRLRSWLILDTILSHLPKQHHCVNHFPQTSTNLLLQVKTPKRPNSNKFLKKGITENLTVAQLVNKAFDGTWKSIVLLTREQQLVLFWTRLIQSSVPDIFVKDPLQCYLAIYICFS
jgi:hypothetical protein